MSGMSSHMSSQDEHLEFAFFCKADNAKLISSILDTINFGKNPIATVSLHKKGMKFTVEKERSLQANVFLGEELFQEFTVKDEPVTFRVHLKLLVECLNIFGSSPNSFASLQMMYSGYGEPLFLMLTENDVITDVGLKTIPSEELLNFNFRSSPVLNKVIVQSAQLKEAFNELDWSSQYVTILLSPDPPHFRLSTQGTAGSCQVDYPKDSEVFEAFECQETHINNYKLKTLQPSIKALNQATKTQLRVNQRGLLSLQHMIKCEDNHTCFVDFFVVPTDEEAADDA